MQQPGHPGFVAPDRAYDCGQCIGWHAERFDFPTLDDHPEGADALQFYFRVGDQQRAGGFGLLGLDYTVLPLAFDLYGIPPSERIRLFENLQAINAEVQAWREEQRELDERKREAKAASQRGSR